MDLIVDQIKKRFGEKEVLKGASYRFSKGKIYGLLGRNGAGKTTFFNCINDDLAIDEGSFYLEEEIMSTNEYPRMIKATDRATMLNLMVGLNGYTLCSGIICEELNGPDYIALPFTGDESTGGRMEIGYITRKNLILSKMGERYIHEIGQYLSGYHRRL